MPTKAELIAATEWLRQHKGDLPPAILPPEAGRWAEIHNGRKVPIVSYNDAMTSKLPAWPGQGDAADLAASPDPTAETVEASLDRISPED